MLAAVLHGPKNITLIEVEKPEPLVGEVRIKLQKVGICGSDLHLYLGHRTLVKPNIIGHEGLGIIDKLGEGVQRKLGERVVIEPNFPCKKCKYCISGRGNICINKQVIGLNKPGAFAEYICVPSDFAWNLPNNISDLDAVCIEPTAVAYSALFKAKTKPGDTIAVIGLGAIGLLLTHIALTMGYKVLVSEINPEKRKMAAKMGAKIVESNGSLEEQAQILNDEWMAADVESIFECAGSHFTASLATEAAPRGSEIILVGLSEKNATFKPLKIAREGISILPSIIYDHPFDFKRVLNLIESKIIKPSFIISGTNKLVNIAEALERASIGVDSKIIIEI